MACKTKQEILKTYKNKGYNEKQLDLISKLFDNYNSTAKTIHTSKDSEYYHTTDEDWNPEDLHVGNELGFHVGTARVANEYQRQALNKNKKNYMLKFKANKDLVTVRLSDTYKLEGGWDLEFVKEELSTLGIDVSEANNLQEVQKILVDLGYDAIEYKNLGEYVDDTINSLIIMNPNVIDFQERKALDDKVLGSREEVYTQLGDRFPGAEKAFWEMRTNYNAKVLEEKRKQYKGKRVGILNNENNSMEFKDVIDVILTMGSYIELVFKDGILIIDPETGISIDGFSEIEGWETTPMYRGSRDSSEAFDESIDLGKLDTKERMVGLLNELNALDPDRVPEGMLKEYAKLIESLDMDGFNELKATLGKGAKNTLGRFVMGKDTINLRVGKFKTLAGNTMSLAETYTHELVHAYTAFGLSEESAKARDIRRKLSHLRDKLSKDNDWTMFLPEKSYDKEVEEANARATWKYVFENKTNADLDEFVAHVMTHPVLRDKAKKLMVKQKTETKSLFDWITNLFQSIMDIVAGRFSIASKKRSVYEEVTELVHALGNINNRAMVEKREKEGLFKKVFESLNKADYKISSMIRAKLDKWEAEMDIEPAPREGTKLQYAWWLVKFLPKAAISSKLRPYLETVMSQLFMKEEGLVQSVLRDFREPTELEKAIDWQIMESTKIDRIRQEIGTAVHDLVLEGFSRELSKEESVALTEVVLETDMQSLLGKYNSNKVVELLSDEMELKDEIAKVKEELLEIADGHGYEVLNQAKGLGILMATGTGNVNQALNVDSIVKGYDVSKKERSLIDSLATLTALEYTNKRERAIVGELLSTEKNGVENLMKLHKNFITESKNTLFGGSPYLMQKGYVKEIFNDSIATVVAHKDEEVDMERKGYEKVYDIPDSESIDGRSGMAMYRSVNFNRSEYYRSATRLTGMASKGTSVKDIAYASHPDLGKELAKKAKAKLDLEAAKLSKKMSREELSDEAFMGNAIPLYNDRGEVVDYRYIMNKDNKKRILEQEKDVAKVMGRSQGSIFDKASTQVHNNKMLNMMFADMDENYVEGSELGKNGWRYIEIGEKSKDSIGRDIWKLLPKDFKNKVKYREESYGKLFVRRDMLLNYFGFRHMSLADSRIANILPKFVRRLVKILEDIWISIVAISKADVLIKMPIVIIDNILSNIFFGIMTDTGPVEIVKMYTDAGKNIRDYINRHTELNKLLVARDSGNPNKLPIHKINVLKRDLERNPIHELMELGIYESIIEDLNTEEAKANNVVSKWINSRVEGMPSAVETTWNWLALNEKTAWYKNMEMMLRMGDLMAQAVQNERVKKVNKKKLAEFRSTAKNGEEVIKYKNQLDKERREGLAYDYVFYSKPSSKVEEYLNRMGFIMFTKYAKRIQRIIGKATLDNPLKAALMMYIDEGLLNDAMPQVLDQTVLDRSWYTIGINPIDHLERLIPPMVRLAY